MAKRKPNSISHPQLTRVLLKSFKLNNLLEKGSFELALSISKEINIESYDPTEDGLTRISVSIKLSGRASIIDAGKITKECLESEASYIGRYIFSSDTSKDDAVKFLEIKHNQDLLVAQVNAIAMTHFKEQLEFSGYSTKGIHLSI